MKTAGRGAMEMDAVRRGSERYARQEWVAAYRAFHLADEACLLSGEDYERLTIAAYMSGHQDEYLTVLERAYHAYLESGATLRAVRCAF